MHGGEENDHATATVAIEDGAAAAAVAHDEDGDRVRVDFVCFMTTENKACFTMHSQSLIRSSAPPPWSQIHLLRSCI